MPSRPEVVAETIGRRRPAFRAVTWGAGNGSMGWIGEIWSKASKPVNEIVAHLVVTVVYVLAMFLVELILRLFDYGGRLVPLLDIPLDD
jgi:hypothetical protein